MCALYVYTNVSFAPNIFMKWKPTKGKMIICETMKYGRAMNFNIVSQCPEMILNKIEKTLKKT